jgi:hypothetical protein
MAELFRNRRIGIELGAVGCGGGHEADLVGASGLAELQVQPDDSSLAGWKLCSG